MTYPKILTALSGNEIISKEMWEKYRKNEIFSIFQNFVYGVPPIDRPPDLSFSVKTIERENSIIQKKVFISFSDYSIEADVFVPKGNANPLPAYLLIMHQFEENSCDIDSHLDFEIIPILDIIKRGYAAVTMKTSKICPDFFTDELHNDGIFSVFDYPKRSNSWSIIASWAWGASRVMDYLETDKDIDAENVALIGHSRSGKTALWAGASDKRFKMIVSNDSGCTGAAFTRGKTGEHLKDINKATDWFCDNYKNYDEDENMLPIDQHMLLALIAPRPLYVASASEDAWADPNMELFACRLAEDAYALYGLDGVIVPENEIKNDTPYHDGHIAYHRRTGKHALKKSDWSFFIDFSDKYLK